MSQLVPTQQITESNIAKSPRNLKVAATILRNSGLYDQDRKANLNRVALPGALEKKYPNAGVGPHPEAQLRHPFARKRLCYDIRAIQELLGHKSLHMTIIYTHVATKNILGPELSDFYNKTSRTGVSPVLEG